MLCYAMLCYTILYYTILYYTILYYTILYYTIPYYTILLCGEVTFCMAAALGMKDLSRDTRLFENFDTDKSGQLDTEELKAGLARLGLRQDIDWVKKTFVCLFVHIDILYKCR